MLDAEPAMQVAVVRAAVDFTLRKVERFPVRADFTASWRLAELTKKLYGRKLPYTAQDVCWIADRLARSEANWQFLEAAHLNLKSLLRSIARVTDVLPEEARPALERFKASIGDAEDYADGRETLALLGRLLGAPDPPLIDSRDDWGFYADATLEEMDDTSRRAWLDLLRALTPGSGSKPSKKWLAHAEAQIDAFGRERFRQLAVEWLRLLEQPSRNTQYPQPIVWNPHAPSALLIAGNADVLKGLAWSCTLVADDALAAALGDAGVACFKKIPDVGARSVKAGNACIYALGAMPTLAAVAQLLRLRQRVRLRSAQDQIAYALDESAHRNGLTRDDLEDLAAPTFGLVDGCLRIPAGPYVAEFNVAGADEVELRWLRPDGKRQASVPAEVKRDHPADLKQVKQTHKDLRTALQAQRGRVESLLGLERTWRYHDWRERYLDHPLLGLISRRLIWTFEHDGGATVGCWSDGRLLAINDGALEDLNDAATVRLWHPINADAATVLGWRQWLERHGVTQPFKQAHREVYLLTDAERATETYSNRFAAHILRQHQFRALCQQRGWRYSSMGAWDGDNIPVLYLPDARLQAEFWVEPIDNDDTLSEHGVYRFIATDQVRFVRGVEALPLGTVPPVVFSEVMRDVDLFVAVCSVGADPNWLDHGPAGHRDYWWDFSFGDLSATAQTRRQVLERLLPRLTKLQGRWELSERFVLVRGDLRSYKIHLGSGNILMEPNDQYLCIVPGRGAGLNRQEVFLPFEGDATLAIIISKALLLADDRAITDPVITNQLQLNSAPR